MLRQLDIPGLVPNDGKSLQNLKNHHALFNN